MNVKWLHKVSFSEAISESTFKYLSVCLKRVGTPARLLMAAILIFGIVIVSSFKGKVLAEYLYEKVTSLTIDSDNTHNISNRSRLGIQYTLGLVFLENPISGVGLGQQAYESIHLYPSWATKNNYEFELKYLNEDVDDFPPGYNLYMRLLAETGIIGFVLFTSLLLFIFLVSLSIIKNDSSLHRIVAVVIFISPY
jgi:O-antigen ligase